MDASPELLLAHEPFLRRLAKSLVLEDERIDDLVQETWVAALKHRPRAEGLRAWLTKVTRNAARQRWRAQSRRRKREERVARPEAMHDDIGRARIRQRVVDAVLRLDEPYRTVILLRHLDGLPPREIAARENVPVETVRTRVKRGLKLLRDDLRGEPEFESWSVALLALLAPAVPSRPLGGLAAAVGVLAMNMKLVVLLLSASVALLLWQVIPERAERQRAAASDEIAPPESPVRESVATTESGTPSPSVTEQPASGRVLLRGRIVTSAQAGPGTASLEVRKPGFTEKGEELRGTAESDGSFEIDLAPIAKKGLDVLLLVVDHPTHLEVVEPVPILRTVDGSARVDAVEIHLRPAAVAEGRVVDAGGNPIGEAQVAIFGRKDGGPIEKTRADAQGRFRLRAADDGRYLVVAVAKGWRPGFVEVEVEVGETAAAAPVVLTPGSSVEGRLTVNSRAPRKRVFLAVRRVGETTAVPWAGLAWVDGRLVRRVVNLVTQDAGAFSFEGLEDGPHEIVYRRHGAFAQILRGQIQPVAVIAPAANVRFDLALAFVRFQVLTPAGPMKHGYVSVGTKRERFGRRLDETGAVTLGMLPDQDYIVVIDHMKAWVPVRREFRTLAAGQTLDLSIDLRPAAGPPKPKHRYAKLIVDLTVDGGGPVPRKIGVGYWREGTSLLERPDLHGDREAGEDGVFACLIAEPGAYRIAVRPGGWRKAASHLVDAWTKVEVVKDQVARVQLTTRLGGRLRLVARAPGGEPIKAECHIKDASGARVHAEFHERRLDSWGGAATTPLVRG